MQENTWIFCVPGFPSKAFDLQGRAALAPQRPQSGTEKRMLSCNVHREAEVSHAAVRCPTPATGFPSLVPSPCHPRVIITSLRLDALSSPRPPILILLCNASMPSYLLTHSLSTSVPR
eukprot:1309997-Rhodomonas_salina.1